MGSQGSLESPSVAEALKSLALALQCDQAVLSLDDESHLRDLLGRVGYCLLKAEPARDLDTYEVTISRTLYAPWKGDAQFVATYDKIKDSTLVDRSRCYELWSLVEQAAKLDGGAIIEVGVWRGGTGALIARKAQLCGIGDPLYLCDTFRGVVKAGPLDPHYRGGEHADTSVGQVETLLQDVGANLNAVRIMQGVFPEEVADRITDLRFRLCHVDVDVYRSAKDIMNWLWERVVPGGIVVFDDYGCQNCGGVSQFIDREQRFLQDRLFIFNTNGHGLVLKR